MASLPQPQFSSSLQLEARLKTCTEQTKAVVSSLTLSVHNGSELSAGHQRLITDAFAVLASLPAHAELTKIERVQKQAYELCKLLVKGIRSLADRKGLFEPFDERVGGMLARVLVEALYRPCRICFPLSDVLCIFGELCMASPTTRAWAVERSAAHQIASLCEQENDAPAVHKQAQIALCKLLYMDIDEHFVFQSRFVDLLMDRTIKTPHDAQRTAWVITVLCKMQENNERALEYIWRRSPVSQLIVDVLSSQPSPEIASKIICLLRCPANKPELRMLLARSGVWEVLHATVGRADVNNMTLQRFAEVFQQFTLCPATGPLVVAFDAYHTLITALKQVKDADATTLDKLLSCAYNCCKQNAAFGAKIAGLGLLAKLHGMCVGARLFTLSIFFAGYAATCDGQDMALILAREVHVLKDMLQSEKCLVRPAWVQTENVFVQVWVRFVSDVRASDIRALPSELVQEFASAVLGDNKATNACIGPALHLLAHLVRCRTDVRVPGHAVRRLADQEITYTNAALCTGLLAFAHSLYFSTSSATGLEASEVRACGAVDGRAGVERQYSWVAAAPRAGDAAAAAVGTSRKRGAGEADAEDLFTLEDTPVEHSGTSSFADSADKDTESEHSADDMGAETDGPGIALTRHDMLRMEDAFPDNAEVLGKLLSLWPVFSPARLDRQCEKFSAAFKHKRMQCLLAMDVIGALLPWHAESALRVACDCGLDQLWNTVEKRMFHCDAQTSVEFIETFARACQLARKTHKHRVLDTLLDMPFFTALITHLQRAVSVHELELAHALVGFLHTVLDVQPDAGALLLLGGAIFNLVGVRDVLAVEAGTGALLHAEIGRLMQRIVPEEHAALLASFEQRRAGGTLGKRKLEEHVHAAGK